MESRFIQKNCIIKILIIVLLALFFFWPIKTYASECSEVTSEENMVCIEASNTSENDVNLINTEESSNQYNDGYKTQIAETSFGKRNLQLNDIGSDVENLQDILASYGYLEGEYIKGTYDKTTECAVKVFQIYHGITPDGICGKITSAQLKNPRSFYIITNGTNSKLVKNIQDIMYRKGFLIVEPDGWWGNNSAKGIYTLNAYRELNSDTQGILTLDALYDLLDDSGGNIRNISGIFRVGDYNNEIIKVRCRLFLAGFCDLEINNRYDDNLRRIVNMYQTYGLINPDGIIGNWTTYHLNKMDIRFSTLKYGRRGQLIDKLQNKLINLGYLNVTADGIFGNATKNAILNWQRDKQLSQTGMLDASMFSLLIDEEANFSKILKVGDKGEDVKKLQYKLQELGYLSDGFMLGVFDKVTENAVKVFQLYNGVVTDGIVGKITKQAFKAPNEFHLVGFGEKSNLIKKIQEIMASKGLLHVKPDGIWGSMSVRGIKAFNSYYGKNITVDSELLTLNVLYNLLDDSGLKLNDFSGYHVVGETPNEDIKKIRLSLYIAGFCNLSNSNEFDAELHKAVKLYQAFGLIKPDGIIGNWTIKHLKANNIFFTPLGRGDSGSLVYAMQERLKEINCLSVKPDGIYGANTYNAVKNFQAINKLTESGTIDLNTALELFDKTYVTKIGIDVSAFQGKIDWDKVKDAGIDFVYIRVGGRYYGSGGMYDDSRFEYNIEEALRVGIKVGVYYFSQAINREEAIQEAKYTIEKIKGYNVSLPVVIDTEYTPDGRHTKLSVEKRTEVVGAFCDYVRKAGYTPMIYANTLWLENNLDMSKLSENLVWVAQWSNKVDYDGPYYCWQYTNSGRVPGINGNVDMNKGYFYV